MTNEKVYAMIDGQISAEPERSHMRLLARQLKEIIAETEGAAELVAQDLQNEELNLKKLEQNFDAFASKHKSGGKSVIFPDEADVLIRAFYGIPKAERTVNKPKTISLFDLMA
ncbi:MAG: hypothetical protein RSC64_06970 [Hydrogenoanaerobacterium sp.]